MDSWHLSTPRLYLRRLSQSDRSDLLAMLSHYDVVKNLAKWPHPVDPDRVDALITRHKSETPGGYAITYGGRLAGMISAGPSIGYFSAPEFWGLGIMTEALAAVSQNALKRHDVLWSGAFEDNPASLRVLEKCGWREVPGDPEFCVARGVHVQERGFVLAHSYHWMQPVRTSRLILRPLKSADFDAFWPMVSDEGTVRMLLSWPWPADPLYLRGRLKNGYGRLGMASAIEREGVVVGMIGYSGGDIWYFMSPEARGQGYGTEALNAKVAQAFADPDVAHLNAGTWDDNPASMRVLDKAGFEKVGWSRAYCRGRNDHAEGPEYRLTRDKWNCRS